MWYSCVKLNVEMDIHMLSLFFNLAINVELNVQIISYAELNV